MNWHTASFVLSLLLLAAPATSHADNLFVSDYFSNLIEEHDSSGAGTVFANSGLSNPQGLAFDSTGNLYVANGNGGMIEKFDLSGVGTAFASLGSQNLSGLAFDNSGNLYVASETYTNSTIVEFTLSGGVLNSNGYVFADLGNVGYPAGVAIDSAGNLYVACSSYTLPNSSFIEKIDPSGVGTVFTRSGLSRPQGLAFDSTGNLYVANFGSNTIEKFSSSGGVLSSNGTVFAGIKSGVFEPLGLAFDSMDDLFVSRGDSKYEELDSTGSGIFFGSTGDQPDFLAVQPIPEPSTWEMVAVGLVALVPLRRRNS